MLLSLPAELLLQCVAHIFDGAPGDFEPLAAVQSIVATASALRACTESLWRTAAKHFLLPLQPLLAQPAVRHPPGLLELRQITTRMRHALHGECFSYVGRQREGDEPSLADADCNEHTFTLSLQPRRARSRIHAVLPERVRRPQPSSPVCSVSWQCTKVASGYKPLTRQEAWLWDEEQVEIHSLSANRYTLESCSRTASRASCRYNFEIAWNGLLVQLVDGKVLQGSGPKRQLGWGVLDDPVLGAPRVSMLPLPGEVARRGGGRGGDGGVDGGGGGGVEV